MINESINGKNAQKKRINSSNLASRRGHNVISKALSVFATDLPGFFKATLNKAGVL